MFCSSAELPCLLQTTAWAAQKGEKSCHLIHFTFGAEIPKLCETHASFFSMQRCRNVAPLLLVEKKNNQQPLLARDSGGVWRDGQGLV